MSLVQTYLENNGYDYYGNAAEDTLVFFVHDEEAPVASPVILLDSNVAESKLGDGVHEMPNANLKQTGMERNTDKNI